MHPSPNFTHMYLSTVPAIIMILSVIVVFSICQVMFVVIGNQIRQSKSIMSTYKIDTMPWFPSSFLLQRFKKVLATKESVRIKYFLIKKKGVYVWLVGGFGVGCLAQSRKLPDIDWGSHKGIQLTPQKNHLYLL